MKIRIMLIITSILFVQCTIINALVNGESPENERDECFRFNNAVVLTVLENEPAYITKGCFKFFGKEDTFAIELVNKPYGANTNLIYPCGGVPENFRMDGLPVLVSGTVFKHGMYMNCGPTLPNVRYLPTNIFELKTMIIAAKQNGKNNFK